MPKTLVLLPGMMCDERIFAPQIEALRGDYEIWCPPLTGEESIEALAVSVLANAPARRFNLLGLSMGAIVAMAMAGKAPERIERLALLDTNHLPDTPERRAIRDRQIADVKKGRLRQVIVDEMKPIYLGEANRSVQPLLDLLVAMAMDAGPEAFIAQSLALRNRGDQSAALKAYRGPALVLHGAEDRLCPPERHQEIAALLAKGRRVEIEGAGHISTLERPDAVTASVRQWLSRC